MKSIKKKNSKDIVLPHSQAKLDLYETYLKHYLRVLGLTPFVSKINLFDIFCGIGKYKDGNIGSPLITNNVIKEMNNEILSSNKKLKQITVSINDKDKSKIDNVKEILEKDLISNCIYNFYNLDADEMLDKVSLQVNYIDKSERNLVFIDPYGYSNIDKNKIYSILKNDKSEIILFLPVMQMYRFVDIANNDLDRKCYEDLRKFIFSFFPSTHKIHSENGIENIFDFINEIKKALSFDERYYTCSHYIERGNGNYYAIFFITANIYGLEKMVETKWKTDPNNGKGFRQNSIQNTLFQPEFIEIDKNQNIDKLKEIILQYLKNNNRINTNEIYELGLRNEFCPTHSLKAIKDLCSIKKLKPLGGGNMPIGYGINYTNYKNKEIKATFELWHHHQ